MALCEVFLPLSQQWRKNRMCENDRTQVWHNDGILSENYQKATGFFCFSTLGRCHANEQRMCTCAFGVVWTHEAFYYMKNRADFALNVSSSAPLSQNTNSATQPLQQTLWSKMGLRLLWSSLQQALVPKHLPFKSLWKGKPRKISLSTPPLVCGVTLNSISQCAVVFQTIYVNRVEQQPVNRHMCDSCGSAWESLSAFRGKHVCSVWMKTVCLISKQD